MSHHHSCCCHDHCDSFGHSHGAHSTLEGMRPEERFISAYWRELFSIIFLISGVIMAHYGLLRHVSSSMGSTFDWFALMWYLIAVAPVSIDVIVGAVRLWRHLAFMNEFTLMLLAAVGAFILGEYPEGVAVLLFYSIGEKMEDAAGEKARDRIRSLLGRLPSKAAVLQPDGSLKEMSPSDVAVGSVIVVKPGDRVPIDGVLQSATSFDTSAITGESVPREYVAGEEVLSGMIPVDREVTLKTVRPFADSSMSRIMTMIESAAAKKSPAETMLRRITRWYTPLVMAAATLLFCVPWIICAAGDTAFEWQVWFNRSLVFLVCSCPCALVVGIPLSYFAAIGGASRMGVLFKGSRYIDSMRRPDAVLFDKTGTLTTGEFHVAAVEAAISQSAGDAMVISLAAALDRESSHPLAKAIVAYASDKGITIPEAVDVVTVNHGVTGKVGGKDVAVGSAKLLQSKDINLPESSSPLTRICVASGHEYIGSVYLEDTLKPESRDAVRWLHRLGVKYVGVLSGDNAAAVERAATAVGADGYEAALLPADKQVYVQRIHDEGKDVVFVGDGINDAPAMAAADVGVSMGLRGTGIAMETSDMVIASDNLCRLASSIRLSRRVRQTVILTVVFAFGVKIAVMILGAFGIATLWAAVFADTGVTILTVILVLLSLRTRNHGSDHGERGEKRKQKNQN